LARSSYQNEIEGALGCLMQMFLVVAALLVVVLETLMGN
jgi:hypothetical protein